MWCQRAMFAALLRPLSVAVALHMHVSRTAVVLDHNFVDVPVTVEEEDSVTVRTHLFFQTSISVLSGLCLMTLYLRFLHNILLFRRGVEGGAWRTPGWRSWQTLSSVMVVLSVLSAFVTTAALTVLLQGSLTGKLVLVAHQRSQPPHCYCF